MKIIFYLFLLASTTFAFPRPDDHVDEERPESVPVLHPRAVAPFPNLFVDTNTVLIPVKTSELISAPQREEQGDYVKILRDDRTHSVDGTYHFDFESEDGIKRSEAGQPKGEEQAVISFGEISFPFPNGQIFTMKYVADENGFQPESPFLPVAPEFPHPIPQFVLDQIEFARMEDELAAAQEVDILAKDYDL